MKKKDNNLKEKKENIKEAKKQLYTTNNSSDELSKLIKIILIVTGIMIIFYGVTVIVTEKAKEASKEDEEATIQYKDIIIGTMFKINGSFYVLIEDENDDKLTEYKTLVSSVRANDDAPTLYTVDLSSSFNSSYLADESNYDSNLDNFKVKGTVLLKIEDHSIKETYDTYDTINAKLEELE